MTSVLFVHNGSPGRFVFIARALSQRGWRCALVNGPTGSDLPGAATVRWQLRRGSTAGIFPPATRAEADLMRGRAAAEAACKLKAQGFDPRLIIGHPGWGEMAFLREVFPQARQIQLGEFYYRSHGADVGFDAEFGAVDFDEQLRVHAKNAVLAMSYAEADRIVVPTPFQASLLPAVFQPRVSVIHEGIDTAVARPQPQAEVRLKGGLVLDRKAPVITFANRFFEPLRGFHILMRALPHVLGAIPDLHVLMIGSESAQGYGMSPPAGKTWKQIMLQELADKLDLSRIHFTGQVSYPKFLTALSISAAHVYLTYPFVLSWSLLDAMACECLVVASDTAPVRDVINPGANGLLVGFFDREGLAKTLIDVCQAPERYMPLRRAARETVVAGFDRASVCEPAWLHLIDDVLRS
jgi:glycosyltransferase involved in cell wall biosynthesis